MNKELTLDKYDLDVLSVLWENGMLNQRIIAEETSISLGRVNKSINKLIENGYVESEGELTIKTRGLFNDSKPNNAIILAAGYGLRMAPINIDNPKALLQVKGEVIIERIIKQLKEVGINNIFVVVGYMKEKFEYLIDTYDIMLIYNSKYADFNNLHSLACATKYIDNTYIIPSDIWCETNPFRKYELYSWYMITDRLELSSGVRFNRNHNLVQIEKKALGNRMIGISYIDRDLSTRLKKKLNEYDNDPAYRESFWEEILFNNGKMYGYGRLVSEKDYTEINTYEQLRELDENSNSLKSEAIRIICETLAVKNKDIINIDILKKGMTNRSFLFECIGKKYIMRIPGEGTQFLIDREHEYNVYNALTDTGINDPIIYINKDNGYKITEFVEEARACNPYNPNDVKKSMIRLKEFHKMKLKVSHEFNLWEQIEFYEELWGNSKSIYSDYCETKNNIFKLKEIINQFDYEKCLTHIDAVPDNFLFHMDKGEEKILIIDWEYAGMQDPHVDIAMFAIYSLYDREHVDCLIDYYFEDKCSEETRIKIYCYIAICGLLWSNWCEYKRLLGIEFGEYSIRQYRYAKEYYRIIQEYIENE